MKRFEFENLTYLYVLSSPEFIYAIFVVYVSERSARAGFFRPGRARPAWLQSLPGPARSKKNFGPGPARPERGIEI